MKEVTIAICSAFIGITCGYLIWKDGDTTTPPCSLADCCRLINDHPDSCSIIIPLPASITPETDTLRLAQAYRNYAQRNTDAYGYSINRDLISYLYGQTESNPRIAGFRLYPGFIETQNRTIFIALVRNGSNTYYSESGDFAKGFQYAAEGPMGYTGPCPTWCDNSSRIIR